MSSCTPDYHVVMVRSGKSTFAASNAHMLWSDVLDVVHDVMSEGCTIEFVHHIHDGIPEDRTREALNAAWIFLTLLSPVTERQKAFLAHHFGAELANEFECEAA